MQSNDIFGVVKSAQKVAVSHIAHRFKENPLLTPKDLKPSKQGMKVECLLNPGVFTYENKTWLLIRVAECPERSEGYVSIPVYNLEGELEILQFDKTDPKLDITDPRVIRYKETDYLTTLSHLRLMCREDDKRFYEPEDYNPVFGKDQLEAYGIEDCRVAEINDVFNLTYTMVSSL
jgi:beta-1,2-mannobiose phosphorylase / 1,2-beta-oligomannan phosphorylase